MTAFDSGEVFPTVLQAVHVQRLGRLCAVSLCIYKPLECHAFPFAPLFLPSLRLPSDRTLHRQPLDDGMYFRHQHIGETVGADSKNPRFSRWRLVLHFSGLWSRFTFPPPRLAPNWIGNGLVAILPGSPSLTLTCWAVAQLAWARSMCCCRNS